MPEYLVGNSTRLVLQLLHHGLHGQKVLGLGPLLVHTGDEVSGTDVVEVVVQDVVATDVALSVNHRVCVELAIVLDFLSAVAQIGVEHALQFDAHDVAPFGLRREVEQVALGHTLHLGVGHPLGVVLIRFLLKSQPTINIEVVETHVAHLTALEIALLHAVEVAVTHVDVVDIGILVEADNLYAVLRLLALDVLHEHIAHGGVVASAANLVVLIVEVNLQDALAALAYVDVLHVDVFDDAATA